MTGISETPDESGRGQSGTFTITAIHVKEGDWVKRDQTIFDVSSDKVDMGVPSPVSGRVRKIFFKVGDVITGLGPVMDIDEQAPPPR